MSSIIQPARILIADVPWKFSDRLPGKGRGAEKHYPCMSVPALMRFPLPPLADDAILFFWRVAAMQQEALDIIRAWDFTVKSELVWLKQTKTGKEHFGMGRYLRASHEVCLVATRGRFKVASRSVRSTFTAEVPRHPTTGKLWHSAKPDRFYQIVRELGGEGPCVELFSRTERPGILGYGTDMPQAAPPPG